MKFLWFLKALHNSISGDSETRHRAIYGLSQEHKYFNHISLKSIRLYTGLLKKQVQSIISIKKIFQKFKYLKNSSFGSVWYMVILKTIFSDFVKVIKSLFFLNIISHEICHIFLLYTGYPNLNTKGRDDSFSY